MVMIDANIALRYLLNDNEEMSAEAERIINEEAPIITPEVIAEVIYVLQGVYDLKRSTIASTLLEFLELLTVQEKQVVFYAIETFGEYNLDFVDCILDGYYKIKKIPIATFDKKLLKLLNEQ